MQDLAKDERVTLEVRHTTRFRYSEPVSLSHSELRMSPVDTGLQRVLRHEIRVVPDAMIFRHRDHFGNLVHHFNIMAPHDVLEVSAHSLVETTNAIACGHESAPDPRPGNEQWVEFLSWSPGVPALEEYASVPLGGAYDSQMAEQEFARYLLGIAGYFSGHFRYDPDVTHVYSSPKELFEQGGGVCQDMAHAMIGVLRRTGIPARYVSGYIFDASKNDTDQSIRGSGATHAWVQAWHEGHGWVGIDPTNNRLADWQYIRTAVGRDYFDVQPLKGVFAGAADQNLEVSVDVRLIEGSAKG